MAAVNVLVQAQPIFVEFQADFALKWSVMNMSQRVMLSSGSDSAQNFGAQRALGPSIGQPREQGVNFRLVKITTNSIKSCNLFNS